MEPCFVTQKMSLAFLEVSVGQSPAHWQLVTASSVLAWVEGPASCLAAELGSGNSCCLTVDTITF